MVGQGHDTDDGNVYLIESTCFCPEYTGFNSMTTFRNTAMKATIFPTHKKRVKM